MAEPPVKFLNTFLSILNPEFSVSYWPIILFGGLAVIILVLIAAAFSGSENALFSLNQAQLESIEEENQSSNKYILFLIQNPKKLLATILIGNTFVNVAMVMVTSVVVNVVFDLHQNPLLGFIVEVFFITFIIVLFGEVIPKIYSVQNNLKVSKFIAVPVYYAYKFFQPLVYLLENSTSIIDKRVTKRGHILSVDELSHAIDITSEESAPRQEKSILKGIVNFGNTNVKEIMRQRPDISAISQQTTFTSLLKQIDELGYSRFPVYHTSLDNVVGILSVKDLLPHINEGDDFNWLSLLRGPFFVPETKKIDDLLKDFQSKRTHLAIVVDEFGGTSGLITMEDILEEIFGEINDEFDEDEIYYSKLDDNTFVFEAKMLINDACKYMETNADLFDTVRNEADTLGGLLLELNGNMPKQNQEIKFPPFTFITESVDKRRIKRIKVNIER